MVTRIEGVHFSLPTPHSQRHLKRYGKTVISNDELSMKWNLAKISAVHLASHVSVRSHNGAIILEEAWAVGYVRGQRARNRLP